MLPASPASRKRPLRSGHTWTSPSCGSGSTARLVGRTLAAGRVFASASASVKVARRVAKSGDAVSGPPRNAATRHLVPVAELLQERILAKRVVRHPVGRAAQNLLAVVAGEQPALMVHGLAEEIRAPDFRFREVHRIGDDRRVREVVAVADEELHDRRLVAFRQPVAAQPALLEVGGLHLERLADEASGRKAHPGVRRVGRRVRPAVHPDRAMAFERLVVPVNGDEPLRVRVSFFPRARVADRAHGVRRDVAVALVVAQRDARRVVGQREEACRPR